MKILDSFEMLGTYHPLKVFHSRRLKSSVSILSYLYQRPIQWL